MKRILSTILIAATLFFTNAPYFSVPLARAATCDNLISWWSMDESSDGSGAVPRADSVVASGNDLTDNNTTASAAGVVSNATDFELANSESLSITDASQAGLDITGDFSEAFWFKPESIPATTMYIQGKWITAGDQRSYLIYSGGGKLAVVYSDDGLNSTEIITNGVVFTAGNTYHAVITVDVSASTGIIYINGSSVAITASGTDTSVFNSTSDFYLGTRSGGPETFTDGLVDELGLWSRILTSDDVTALYNAGAGVSYATACGGAAAAKKKAPPIIFFE